ncbi:MAG: hypothetical protein IK118_08885 [Clostridia bacterium]|nr:hypothetical protein [Clostridia bacterium]
MIDPKEERGNLMKSGKAIKIIGITLIYLILYTICSGIVKVFEINEKSAEWIWFLLSISYLIASVIILVGNNKKKNVDPASSPQQTAPTAPKNEKSVSSSQPTASVPRRAFEPITPDVTILSGIYYEMIRQLPDVLKKKYLVGSDAFWSKAFVHLNEFDADIKSLLLCCACRAFRTEEIELLLDAGVDPNTYFTVDGISFGSPGNGACKITPFLFFCSLSEKPSDNISMSDSFRKNTSGGDTDPEKDEEKYKDIYTDILKMMIAYGANPALMFTGFYYDGPGIAGQYVSFGFSTKEIIEHFHEDTAEKIFEAIYQRWEVKEFGVYPQQSETEKKPVEWFVLADRGDCKLLLSKYALDYMPFSGFCDGTTWEESNTRKWLNDKFMAAFPAEEQKHILSVKRDRIFLLSEEEANKYFSSDAERQCKGTEYCYKRGAQQNDGYCYWLLRSTNRAVDWSGRICTECEMERGIVAVPNHSAVRPAMWVSL